MEKLSIQVCKTFKALVTGLKTPGDPKQLISEPVNFRNLLETKKGKTKPLEASEQWVLLTDCLALDFF